jgi:hypothetical protein
VAQAGSGDENILDFSERYPGKDRTGQLPAPTQAELDNLEFPTSNSDGTNGHDIDRQE